ncbi:MAG: hypothetical protein ACXVZ2_04120 [Gaiellaceae bacterium]
MIWPIAVTLHGLAMAGERAGIRDRAAVAERVAAALQAGRVSAERPRWLERRPKREQEALYVWDEDGIVYVVAAGSERFTVLTVLVGNEEFAA